MASSSPFFQAIAFVIISAKTSRSWAGIINPATIHLTEPKRLRSMVALPPPGRVARLATTRSRESESDETWLDSSVRLKAFENDTSRKDADT